VKNVLIDKKGSGLFQYDCQEQLGTTAGLEQIEMVKPIDMKSKCEDQEEGLNKDNVTQFDVESAKQLFSKYYKEK
jgi:hypothetical protein